MKQSESKAMSRVKRGGVCYFLDMALYAANRCKLSASLILTYKRNRTLYIFSDFC